MAVDIKTIGSYENQPVTEATLVSSADVRISIISFGARVKDWRVPVSSGHRSVVVGYPDLASYLEDPNYYGAIIGRVANRISNARFSMNGKEFYLDSKGAPYMLHGGPKGLSQKNWWMKAGTEPGSVLLTLHSPAGEMGFPGDVDFSVLYALKGSKLSIEMRATSNQMTPVNVVQHNYFNLLGAGTILDHRVQVSATRYTPLDENLIPTGELLPVQGTRNDLRTAKPMRESGDRPAAYDINLVFDSERSFDQPVATVTAPDESLRLRLWTDQPGLQLYNGSYQNFAGFCLEDQQFPDAVNKAAFPSILISPEKPYLHRCAIEIS